MASIKAAQFLAPKFMAGDGCGTIYVDTAAIAAALSVNDTVEFAIPAGAQVCGLEIDSDRLDTGAGLTWKVGYKSIAAEPTLAANDSYWGAGLTFGRAAGRSLLAGKPITFSEPVAITLTATGAAATFQAGSIAAVATANCVGIR